MARKTKEDAQKTRESLLAAASLVFVKKGVAQASLDEIASLAGVTRGAFYWHFKNKIDIFCALHEQLHEPFTQMVMEDLENNHPEPLQQLEELCVKLLREIAEDKQKKQLLTIFYLKCDYSGELEPILESQVQQRAECFKLLSCYVERAQIKRHLSKDTTPDMVTLALFCYLNGIVQEYIRYNQSMNLKVKAPILMRQFFIGLRSKT